MRGAWIHVLAQAALCALAAMPTHGMAQGSPAGAAKESEPAVVVHHPLTRDERMREKDYASHRPLMEGIGAASRGDPAAVEERASLLLSRPPLTEGPFVDWARAAALALAELDSGSASDRERAKRWGELHGRLQSAARERFFANQELRAETVADNALCAYRETQIRKEQCLGLARAAAKEMDPALDLGWPSWAARAALGLAAALDWPSGWGAKREALAARGREAGELDELGRKARALDAWAAALGERVERTPFSALAEARGWASRTGWEPRARREFGPSGLPR